MKWSPTTIIGYVRGISAIAICAKPIYNYWVTAATNYDAVKECAVAAALASLVQGVISMVAGHLTADAKDDK